MARTKAVLIIGGSGAIGTRLALRLRDKYKVFATYLTHPILIPGVTTLPMNAANRNWIKRVVYTAKPDVIIYAAGSNSVAWAESNTRDAESAHTSGAATVSNIAEIFSPRFIYLSNCYPFDGSRGNYHETDTVLPTTVLGKAKIGGENFIRGKCLNYVIVRSSPTFGRGNGQNLTFLDRLRMALDRGQRVDLPNDELHNFVPTEGLVTLIERLAESGLRNRILHYGGLTKVGYHEFGQRFARHFGYDPKLLVLRERRDRGRELPVQDYSLNFTGAVETLKIKPLLLEEGFDLVEKNLVPGP